MISASAQPKRPLFAEGMPRLTDKGNANSVVAGPDQCLDRVDSDDKAVCVGEYVPGPDVYRRSFLLRLQRRLRTKSSENRSVLVLPSVYTEQWLHSELQRESYRTTHWLRQEKVWHEDVWLCNKISDKTSHMLNYYLLRKDSLWNIEIVFVWKVLWIVSTTAYDRSAQLKADQPKFAAGRTSLFRCSSEEILEQKYPKSGFCPFLHLRKLLRAVMLCNHA